MNIKVIYRQLSSIAISTITTICLAASHVYNNGAVYTTSLLRPNLPLYNTKLAKILDTHKLKIAYLTT